MAVRVDKPGDNPHSIEIDDFGTRRHLIGTQACYATIANNQVSAALGSRTSAIPDVCAYIRYSAQAWLGDCNRLSLRRRVAGCGKPG
jgi:hypothetical protein